MDITFEVPIGEEDLRLTEDGRTVALTMEKFEELVGYVEYLEGAVKFADCEFRQERYFADFTASLLAESLRMLSEPERRGACAEAARRWGAQLRELYRGGEIRRESMELLSARLAEFTEEAADAGATNA